MANLTIRLVLNPATGKREIDIAYQSDADALPNEHEEEHRRLVQKIVGSLQHVERTGVSEKVPVPAAVEDSAEREKLKQ